MPPLFWLLLRSKPATLELLAQGPNAIHFYVTGQAAIRHDIQCFIVRNRLRLPPIPLAQCEPKRGGETACIIIDATTPDLNRLVEDGRSKTGERNHGEFTLKGSPQPLGCHGLC